MVAAGHTASTSPAMLFPRRRNECLLLVIEPQAAVALTLQKSQGKQFGLFLADNAVDGLLAAGEYQPDVVLTAACLCDISCERLVSALRRHRSVPVIVAQGPGDGSAARAAIRAGATVCVSRPYFIPDLETLVRCLRQTEPLLPPIECGSLRLDPQSQRVFVDGRAVDLPLQELHLLHLLMTYPDRILTREQIRELLWPDFPDERSNTITVHIRRLRLRLRLGEDAWHPTIITTVRGMGYRFSPPNEVASQ